METRPERIAAILEELDRAAEEYTAAKAAFDRGRVFFEAAREKFAGVRRLASEMVTSRDWYSWVQAHADVKYAAMPIGDAILSVLTNHAYTQAYSFASGQVEEFVPQMTMEKIVETLETGGFEFRSTSPLREVNAALINLAGVTKSGPGFQIADTTEAMQWADTYVATTKVDATS